MCSTLKRFLGDSEEEFVVGSILLDDAFVKAVISMKLVSAAEFACLIIRILSSNNR